MRKKLFLLTLFFTTLALSSVFAQSLNGKVTDTNGDPLIGATVLVKGTEKGTATDADGNFSLRSVADNAVLIISYTGFITREVPANGDLNITLEEGAVLGEVIVTAENRAVNAQSVPISLDLVSGGALLKQGAADLLSIQNLAPGLNIVQNTVFNQVTVRGVGSHDGAAELSDQAVTVGIDGEYINRPVALNASLFDINRIEVLKGPQGTLYGRNATAGAVNIIANKPTDRTEVDLSAMYGNYNTLKLNGALNLPLGKIAAVRLAGMLSKHDGYRDGGPAGKIDNGNVWGARLGFSLNPSSAFSVYVAGEYNKTDQQAPSQYGRALSGDATLTGKPPASYSTELPEDYDVATAGFLKIDQGAVRTKIAYNLGKATISYSGGFRDVGMTGYQPLNGFVPETFSFDNNLDYQTQSHELRINGESSTLVWQAGLFHGNEDQHVARGLVLPVASGAFGGKVPYLNFFLFDVTSKTTGVFGQATLNLSEKFGITAGLRNTSDSKTKTGSTLAAPPFVPGATQFFYPNHPTSTSEKGMAPLTGVPTEGSWSKLTWLLNLELKPTPQNLLFAKVSTGYKAGGFDNVGAYDPENLTAIEIGSKNKFADNRLRLNASLFHYDYKDQQVSVFISTEVGGAIQNAGHSIVNGLEIDGEFLASKADKLRFTINYLDSEFKDLPTQVNVVGGNAIVTNLKGNTPVQSPKWTLIGGYDHDFRLGSGTLNLGIQTMFKSEYYLSPFNFNMDKQEAFTKTDASITYTGKNGRWDIGAFVQNIEDNRILTFAAFTGGTINIYNWIFGVPRTFGIQLGYHLN